MRCAMYSDILFDYVKSCNVESDKDINWGREDLGDGIVRERYEIKTDDESLEFGKPIGKYELLSIPNTLVMEKHNFRLCVKELSKTLKSLVGNITLKDRVLIVGLGNRHISSDSLGAKVVGKINITINNDKLPKVMAISPSVMGLTGIETVDIVEGVIMKTHATHVILIDSLCASSASRLGTSIQVTNTGICPGGGVGNRRKCIDKSIARNVYSIGVPLLIYASTFVSDTLTNNNITDDVLNSIMQNTIKTTKNKDVLNIINSLRKVIKDDVDNMIVCLKDIEDCVEILSDIISQSINIALGVDEEWTQL